MAPATVNDLGEDNRDDEAYRLTAGNKLIDALQEI
jgi:hypothetical protein